MAASTTSMAGNKRNLANISVEDFMSAGYGSSDGESDKPAKKVKRSLKAVKKISKSPKNKSGASVSGHLQALGKLQEQDPEFYEFLKDEDKNLLKFGAADDDEDVSDEESMGDDEEEEDDDDEEEEDDLVIESSGEEDEEEDREMIPQKKKAKAKEVKEKSAKKAAKSKISDEEMKKLAEKIFDDDVSDSEDEEGLYHKPPQELELASDDEEGGETEEKASRMKNNVTLEMVKGWTKRFKTVPSLKLIQAAVQAFKAAVSQTSSVEITSKFIIKDPKVFNAVVRMCLMEIPTALQKLLDMPSSTDLEKPVLPSNGNEKWRKMKKTVRVYLMSILQLMTSLSQVDMIDVLLKHIHKMIAFYASFPKPVKIMLKRTMEIWSTGEETSRVLAFLCINRISRILQDSFLESNIKHMYMAYVKNCKFTSPNTLPLINFMQRSLVEMLMINVSLAYQYAFVYIRQLAIHLRNAITLKKKDSCHAVYNWQYIHCLGLWVRLLSLSHPNPVLQPLIYPLTQTIIGTIKLIPTQKYYPLRFHCVRGLTTLSRATNTFIPVLPYLMEVFEQTNFNKKHKSMSFKPFNFDCMLKLSKSQLQERAYKDGLIDALYELLLEQLNAHANTIGFPELTLPVVLQLKDFLKKCKVGNFCKQIKQILDKVEENAKFVTNRRRTATISLADSKAIESWERQCQEAGTPIGSFYTRWRKLRDREMMHKIAGRDQIVGMDGLPEMKVKSRPRKATEEDKKSFSALFESDSDDDTDHTLSLLPSGDGKKKQTKGQSQDSDSDADYSDFDDDELEQLAGSADDDSDDEDVEIESDDDNDEGDKAGKKEVEAGEDSEDAEDDEEDEDEGEDEGDIVEEFDLSSDED